MKSKEVSILFRKIQQLQSLKKTKYEFRFMLIEIKKIIKDHIEDYDEKMTALREEAQDLIQEYCTKDEEDKAIIIEGQYQGIMTGQEPEYDKRIKELNDKTKELMNTEIEFPQFEDIKPIKQSLLPKDMDGLQQEALQMFIED